MSLKFKTFEWSDKFAFPELEVIEGPPYRQYVVGDDKFPSMTSILKVLEEDDSWFYEWAARLPGGEAEAHKIVKDAVERGNNLHFLSECYLQNTLERKDIVGPGSVMFNRARRHLDELQVIHGIEVPVYSRRYSYAGRLDCLATDIENDFCIVDHKNSRTPINIQRQYGRKKLFKYMLQCCGYSKAVEEMHGVRPTHGLLIVSNFSTMDSKKFKFPLKPLDKNFVNLVESFYGRADVKENDYFKL
jgi:genome maintenance exonuclease 1